MMHPKVLLFLLLLFTLPAHAQRLMVSENNRFLVTEDGKPFFWLADTAWELFHRCNQEEADMYLTKRAEQGFNVVQAVALAQLDGLHTPNPYGEVPLHDLDPTRPNEKYFEHVDYIIKKADDLGIYVALLPTWGDKVFSKGKDGPEIFNPTNARVFGDWIGNRYRDFDNIVWVVGGDRSPRDDSQDVVVWNAMAEGIAEGTGGYDKALMSFHPAPRWGSSNWFHQEQWLDFNMFQTGHCPDKRTYGRITRDYNLRPIKPVLDGEPLYEDHPNCFNAKELGYSIPEDIRRRMYWNVFAGAFGQSYGCHAVWQMYTLDKEPKNQPLRPWPVALDLPMANQARHLKNLMLSRPFLTRIPDQSMVIDAHEDALNGYVIATRDSQGTYAMIYFPTGIPSILDLTKLSGQTFDTWWFDPRTGNAFQGASLNKSDKISIEPPTSGKGHDWVLVVDDPARAFEAPGKTV